MTRIRLGVVFCLVGWVCGPDAARASDWLTDPSTYTHDNRTGQRVTQYSPIGPFYYHHRADFQRSGYRHFRSTIQAGGSADNYHLVEEYGRPVRPYEEWRFPLRPYSAPYAAWGPPYGGLGGGYGFGYGGYGFGFPFGPGFPPAGGGPGPVGPGPVFPGPGPAFPGYPPVNYAQPWVDGYYPSYDRHDRSPYYESYP